MLNTKPLTLNETETYSASCLHNFLVNILIYARLFFFIVHHEESARFGFEILAGTFSHGIKLDISATAYILVIPMLALLPSVWIKADWLRHFLRFYTWIILFISSAIIVGDAE